MCNELGSGDYTSGGFYYVFQPPVAASSMFPESTISMLQPATHQAALAPQPPMNPPMTMATHQTPGNSYPMVERERPFACPDCEKAYPTAAGLCAPAPSARARPHPHVSAGAPPGPSGSYPPPPASVRARRPHPHAAPSAHRSATPLALQTSTSAAPTRTSSTLEDLPGRSPARSERSEGLRAGPGLACDRRACVWPQPYPYP